MNLYTRWTIDLLCFLMRVHCWVLHSGTSRSTWLWYPKRVPGLRDFGSCLFTTPVYRLISFLLELIVTYCKSHFIIVWNRISIEIFGISVSILKSNVQVGWEISRGHGMRPKTLLTVRFVFVWTVACSYRVRLSSFDFKTRLCDIRLMQLVLKAERESTVSSNSPLVHN